MSEDKGREAGKISQKGIEMLDQGLIDDPYVELMLEILRIAAVPLFRDNVIETGSWLIEQFGSPEEAVEALRDGRAGIEKVSLEEYNKGLN
jgi:hypothetical protein